MTGRCGFVLSFCSHVCVALPSKNAQIITEQPRLMHIQKKKKGGRERRKNPPNSLSQQLFVISKNPSLAEPKPNIASVSWQTGCCITSSIMSCCNGKLPAKTNAETVSWGVGQNQSPGTALSVSTLCSHKEHTHRDG